LEFIRREYDNMRAALQTFHLVADVRAGLQLCQALSGFWLSHGFLSEGENWLLRFIELDQDGALEWELRAQGLHSLRRGAQHGGRLDAARNYFEKCLTIATAHAGTVQMARAVLGLGEIAEHQGDYAAAQKHFHAGLELARAAGDLPDIADALMSLARDEHRHSELARSRTYREEALELLRRIGDEWGVAFVLNELAQQARGEGEHDRAQVLEAEAYTLWRASGSRMGERAALMNLTVMTFERGDLKEALVLLQGVLNLCKEIGDASATTARCIEISAQLVQAQGHPEVTARLVAAASTRREVLGAPLPPNERSDVERALERAQACLAANVFRQAVRSGSELSMKQAIDMAVGVVANVG
jgi:tetratricopeptide (TPR) repeat protein